jgi:hypothetical protein
MVSCIRELALEGKPVKLDNLAIIKCQVETTGANSYADFNLQKNVRNIKLSAVSTGEFTRKELNKSGRLEYTSMANYLRNPEDDGNGGN